MGSLVFLIMLLLNDILALSCRHNLIITYTSPPLLCLLFFFTFYSSFVSFFLAPPSSSGSSIRSEGSSTPLSEVITLILKCGNIISSIEAQSKEEDGKNNGSPRVNDATTFTSDGDYIQAMRSLQFGKKRERKGKKRKRLIELETG